MKKALAIGLCAAMVTGLLGTGCMVHADDAAEAPASSDVSLTMWTFPFGDEQDTSGEQANYETLAAEFEEQTGIHVNVEILPWANRETKLLTAIASGDGPDIMYLNPDILKQFQAYGVLSPITEYVTDEDLSGYSASMLDNSVRIDGELYGVPILVDLGRPVYNLDLLAEIGMTEENLPTTYEEFDAMLAALKEKDIYGIYYNYSGTGVNNGLFAQFFSEGCDVVKEDGTVDIDGEAGRKVLERVASWYQNGYTPTDSLSILDNSANFISGNVASDFSVNGSSFFIEIAPDLTFNWAAGPILSGDAGQYGISTVGSLGVSRDCDNVEAATEWIKFFTEPERLAAWDEFSGYICPIEGAESPFTEVKGYEYLLENLDCVRGEPNHAAARTMNSVFIPDLQSIVSGDVSLDDGIAKMKTDLEGVVSTVDALRN